MSTDFHARGANVGVYLIFPRIEYMKDSRNKRGTVLDCTSLVLIQSATKCWRAQGFPCLSSPTLVTKQTLLFEYAVAEGDLTAGISLADRHALEFGFNASFGARGYESKLRSLVAQASTNPTVAMDRVRENRKILPLKLAN